MRRDVPGRRAGGGAAGDDALFAERIAALPEPEALKDAKTRLQEYLQARGLPLPRYAVLERRRRGPCADVLR